MADAYVHALQVEGPADSILGVYLKGSSCRPWDTLIDYVPELSDVDIHVRLTPSASSHVEGLAFALAVADEALAAFRARFPNPLHTPRPQLFFMRDLEAHVDYVPSPPDSVVTLLGPSYKGGGRAEYADCLTSDARQFRADAHFIARELPGKLIDRPGTLRWPAVARIMWRVGPAGPRLLTQLGMDPFDAWSLNRTSVVNELKGRGQASIAASYADFYLAGWDGFRSGFEDQAAAGRALMAASRMFEDGSALLDGRSVE